MNTPTVRTGYATRHESRRHPYGGSATLRAHDAATLAARFMTRAYPPGTKVMGVSAQAMSAARETVGCVGKVAAIMSGRPDRAMQLAVYLTAHARSVTQDAPPCLSTAISRETRADSEQDVARDDVRARESADTLRTYIEQLDREIATKQEARDAAARRLAELEGGR